MSWYLEALRNYAKFSGRARRSEYWFFVLFYLIFGLVAGVVDGLVGSDGFVSVIYLLAMFIPSLSVTVRRLHDTDRSGWWLLISFIPLIGAIVLLVFTVLDSTPGQNQYGPNPKESTD